MNASISISLLPVGHTKFSPDWCFGLLKQKFRKAEVDSLDDFVQVVEQSSAVNKAQPVGSSNGELIVETFDLSSYFQHPLSPFNRRGTSLSTTNRLLIP